MALDENITTRWHSSEILLMGGSAGSFKLLFKVIQFLPADLNKSVIIVMHRKRNFASEIENLFARNSMMKLQEIGDKDKISKHTIYVAPANYHVLIEADGHFALDVSEPVWFSKPSIDITFESAAETYKDKCTAILLSGANQDGAAGMLKLRDAGSLTIAQDPAEAELPEMPQEAINLHAADYVLTTEKMIELLLS